MNEDKLGALKLFDNSSQRLTALMSLIIALLIAVLVIPAYSEANITINESPGRIREIPLVTRMFFMGLLTIPAGT